jgi:hypothetical protein
MSTDAVNAPKMVLDGLVTPAMPCLLTVES